ncbi:MAG: hypothetical protein OXG15_08345 [Gammaproteobacteria bacterium]|nr:hypothetical protein [Gammaproteobacteria bacterium]
MKARYWLVKQWRGIVVSRLTNSVVVIAFANLGCSLTTEQSASSAEDVPPIYDTHETYDAKVEQYWKDYGKWLNKRRATYRHWKESILKPAHSRVSDDQRDEYESSVKTDCVAKPERSSLTYLECTSALFEELLHTVYDGYQSLEEYETEHGAGPEPEYPKYNLAPSPPTEHDIEYESAKRECAEKGGTWIWYLHYHAKDFDFYGMRCLKKDIKDLNPRPEQGDPIWNPLLHYEIDVKRDPRSRKLLEFRKTDPIDLLDLAG